MNAPLEIEHVKRAVNESLDQLFVARMGEAQKIDASYARLWQTMQNTVRAGGKRLRPYLVVVGGGQVDRSTLPIACAYELVHAAMLMHDDIIDRDDMRHGVLNMNGHYSQLYSRSTDRETARHHGQSAGILAGDALIAEAFALLAEAALPVEVYKKVLGEFRQAIFDVVGGELLDVEAGFLPGVNPITIAHYKTAIYSVVAPLCSGAYCAGRSEQEITLLRKYGRHVGVAFQLQDDVIGLFGDANVSGKSTTSDLIEGKRTALIEAFLRRAETSEKAIFEAVFANQHATDQQLADLKSAIVHSGAKEEITELYKDHFLQAKNVAEKLEDTVLRERLQAFITLLQGRGV
jgi:geranylgeranyl diphosphate synthase type II